MRKKKAPLTKADHCTVESDPRVASLRQVIIGLTGIRTKPTGWLAGPPPTDQRGRTTVNAQVSKPDQSPGASRTPTLSTDRCSTNTIEAQA